MPVFTFGFRLPDPKKLGSRWDKISPPEFLAKLNPTLPAQELFLFKSEQGFQAFAVSEQRDTLFARFYQILQKEFDLPVSALEDRFQINGRAAVREFYRLAIGIDRDGEAGHSVESFREWFAAARRANLVGPYLNKLFQRSLWLSEKVRIELNVQKHAINAESVVTELAQKIFGDLRDHKALIAANGVECETFAQKLRERNIGELLFVAREHGGQQKLIDHFAGSKVKLDQLKRVWPTVDVLLMFESFAELFKEMPLSEMMSRRQNKPLLLVSYLDEPAQQTPDLYNLYYYHQDDLKQIVASNLKEHQKAEAMINQFIEQEVEDFLAWVHGRDTYRFGNIIAKSSAMQNILELVARIAQTDISVLIDGESGTGKELVARAIHDHSGRAKNPFMVVNCSALPESLLESELFGHVRGAFTGATANKKGLIEAASKGTIFLDEIGETSLAMQVKLLRFLQEGEIKPVGSNQTLKVDVRLIAATNRDLLKMMEEGRFRQDLYYRLNVIQITIPPLRDRVQDILPLSEYFIKKYSQKIHKTVYGIEEEMQKFLCHYSWPGNVRELENAIERAVALCSGKYLTKANFPANVLNSQPTNHHLNAAPDLTLKTLERNHIAAMLEEFNWNYDRVTKILGIGRTTLWRKMKEYNLSNPQNREVSK
jgi:glutamyl-tRNA reductase